MRTLRVGGVVTLLACLCSSAMAQQTPSQALGNPGAAVAEVSPLAGSNVKGTVRFENTGPHVRIHAAIDGLSKGKHGFHVHEGTSCEKPGQHFGSSDRMHGAPTNPGANRHQGDLGNLVADESGTAQYESIDHHLALEGNASIVGHVVVIHRGEDDYLSQPSGESGDPIACGKIKAAG